MTTSRLPGFYKLSIDERQRAVATQTQISEFDLRRALSAGGMEVSTAEKTVENVIGTYSLPFSVGLNITVNGTDHLAPMVVEEPSVVAAMSNASRMVRDGGGFTAETDEPLMIAQIHVDEVLDVGAAFDAIESETKALLVIANRAVPGLVMRGGGARELECRDLGDGLIAIHVIVDCRNAMGANLVNTIAEALAPHIADLTRGIVALRILSNLADRRCVRVTARVPVRSLATETMDGLEVARGIARASRIASRDPYRAATHNKGIMNGIDAVVMATGNDWRAVEAGAHAFAARDGAYRPLATWTLEGEMLVGSLELPLALGTVGGPIRIHRGAALALRLAKVDSAADLAMLAGCAGLASNLAALRALTTEGIQHGHMALHARSVAVAAGAKDDEVEQLASLIHSSGAVTLENAQRTLVEMRGPHPEFEEALVSGATFL